MHGGPSQEVLLRPLPPPSLPWSTNLFSASDALLGLTLLPIFNYYYYCHPCHAYILCAPNGPYINSLNFHDLLGLCYPGVINEGNDLQKISETCARLLHLKSRKTEIISQTVWSERLLNTTLVCSIGTCGPTALLGCLHFKNRDQHFCSFNSP